MSEGYRTFAEMIENAIGGAGLAVMAALLGRSMWHIQEARKGRRKFLGPEILWELPIAIGMVMIGEALNAWLGFQQPVSTGVVAALAYLGPRGAEVLFMRWFGKKATGE